MRVALARHARTAPGSSKCSLRRDVHLKTVREKRQDVVRHVPDGQHGELLRKCELGLAHARDALGAVEQVQRERLDLGETCTQELLRGGSPGGARGRHGHRALHAGVPSVAPDRPEAPRNAPEPRSMTRLDEELQPRHVLGANRLLQVQHLPRHDPFLAHQRRLRPPGRVSVSARDRYAKTHRQRTNPASRLTFCWSSACTRVSHSRSLSCSLRTSSSWYSRSSGAPFSLLMATFSSSGSVSPVCSPAAAAIRRGRRSSAAERHMRHGADQPQARCGAGRGGRWASNGGRQLGVEDARRRFGGVKATRDVTAGYVTILASAGCRLEPRSARGAPTCSGSTLGH